MAENNNTSKKHGGKRENSRNTNKIKAHRETFSTYDGHTLTPKEARFIDLYIQYSNGKKAYEEAYGNPDNPDEIVKAAAQKAQRVLNKPHIISEINHRLEMAKSASIAEADEIMQYFTAVMRGEIKDQFGLEASLGERTKAAQELARRKIDIPQRLAGNEQPEVKIVLDWTPPTITPVLPKTETTEESEGDN